LLQARGEKEKHAIRDLRSIDLRSGTTAQGPSYPGKCGRERSFPITPPRTVPEWLSGI
jgi:hypothetical protein